MAQLTRCTQYAWTRIKSHRPGASGVRTPANSRLWSRLDATAHASAPPCSGQQWYQLTGYQAELTRSAKLLRSTHQGRASAQEPRGPGALGAALSFPRALQPAPQVRAALAPSTITEQPLRWKWSWSSSASRGPARCTKSAGRGARLRGRLWRTPPALPPWKEPRELHLCPPFGKKT